MTLFAVVTSQVIDTICELLSNSISFALPFMNIGTMSRWDISSTFSFHKLSSVKNTWYFLSTEDKESRNCITRSFIVYSSIFLPFSISISIYVKVNTSKLFISTRFITFFYLALFFVVFFKSWLVFLLVKMAFMTTHNLSAITHNFLEVTLISSSSIFSNISSALTLSSIGALLFTTDSFFWNCVKNLAGNSSTSTMGF